MGGLDLFAVAKLIQYEGAGPVWLPGPGRYNKRPHRIPDGQAEGTTT